MAGRFIALDLDLDRWWAAPCQHAAGPRSDAAAPAAARRDASRLADRRSALAVALPAASRGDAGLAHPAVRPPLQPTALCRSHPPPARRADNAAGGRGGGPR